MSKIEDKAVDIMDKAMVGAEKLTEKLAELAVQYGPDVVNAAVEVARIEALSGLVRPAAALAICLPMFILAIKRSAAIMPQNRMWHDLKDSHALPISEGGKHATKTLGHGPKDGELFLCAIVSGFSFAGSGFAIYSLSSVWNWVGIFEPKLWIAHRILEKAL